MPDFISPTIARTGHLDQFIHLPGEASHHKKIKPSLRKPSVSKDVNLRALAKCTNDVKITYIFHACKYAIKDNLRRILRRRKRINPEATEENDTDDVTAHFEESMKFARCSVTDADLRKYQAFAQKALQQSRGFRTEFCSEERSDTAAGA